MDANSLTAVSIIAAAVPTWLLAWRGLRQGQENGAKADYAATSAAAAGTAASTAALKAQVAATKAESAADLAKDASGKADTIIAGNTEIHRLVNSGSDAMKRELVIVKEELAAANARTDKLAATVERLLATGVERRAIQPSDVPVRVEVTNVPLATTVLPAKE
jgi:hypothetical protein